MAEYRIKVENAKWHTDLQGNNIAIHCTKDDQPSVFIPLDERNSDYQEVRGTVVDTVYTNSTTTGGGGGLQYGPLPGALGTYYYDRFGSGSTNAEATYYFIMSIGAGSSYLR